MEKFGGNNENVFVVCGCGFFFIVFLKAQNLKNNEIFLFIATKTYEEKTLLLLLFIK